MAQHVKNLLAMQETQEMQVQLLSGDCSLEEEMATHFSILDWEIPWIVQSGGLQYKGSQGVGHD